MSGLAAMVYRGSQAECDAADVDRWLGTAPPWRKPGSVKLLQREHLYRDTSWTERGKTYMSSPGGAEVRQVNVALLLRRPLLVTGAPGIGKSTLAYHIAYSLRLGPPLRWEINSRTTLEDGLYSYDAVGHLQSARTEGAARPIGEFITLGPLGTALLPTPLPRVLLIDELDKASYDLPNDLLHVFEEASFRIPQLIRLAGAQEVYPRDRQDDADRVALDHGTVRAHHHPVVVITSNGEREFPPAFLRRCVKLHLERPGRDHMAAIVASHLGGSVSEQEVSELVGRFGEPATDVVLQALFLEQLGLDPAEVEKSLEP
ncbi:MAG: MoxR family ATPase [Candidatus Riflebacteria bacterium]|nr:MoxR family ATPase [Candidatus Riflebacteria bacterium]